MNKIRPVIREISTVKKFGRVTDLFIRRVYTVESVHVN